MQRYVSKELTHFVGKTLKSEDDKYRALLQIVSSGYLRPSSSVSSISEHSFGYSINFVKSFSENAMYNPDMICFCDIPVQDLMIHQRKYSKFGISFLKSFLITKGTAPVFYIPKN